MKEKIKFIDLFAGIGGFHKALEIVAKNNNFDIECVFVSEIDQESIKTYSNNFSVKKEEIINIRDIDQNSSQVPEHNFLFAGFPCQTFSNAGNKKGFLDEIRGTLFFDIAKILENKKPKYILLENVKHLVNHNNGETWNKIIETLKYIGYIIPEKPLILSPHEFGIPQERQRVFIPGVLKEKTDIKDEYISFNFDDLKLNNKLNSSNPHEIREYIYTKYLEEKFDNKYFLKNSKEKYLIKIFEAWDNFLKNVKKPEGRTLPVIWANEFGKSYNLDELNRMPKWRKKYILDMQIIYKLNKDFIDNWLIKYKVNTWKKREQKFEWQAGKDINDLKHSFIQLRQSGIRCRRPIKFPTLVAMVQIPIIYDEGHKAWRYLTPRETANLQCFPDDYKLHNEIDPENKDFYSYKQFGNSVNVSIVSYIQEYLLKHY